MKSPRHTSSVKRQLLNRPRGKMAEKRKGKKRKEEFISPGDQKQDKPTKEEFTIAKWMRKNVPIKKTKFMNHNVEYFTAKRAVDAILESEWVTGDTPTFKTREDIVDYLHVMLEHKFYHRARKVPVPDHELAKKKKEPKKVTGVEITDSTTEKDKVGTDAESSVMESGVKDKDALDKEKKKKKIRLEMHNDQRFVDGLDAYVWIYDPIPFHYWIFGTLLVLGAIGVCLFPLWPPSVRLGVYYLSVAAAGFLVSIIVLAIIRLIVFCLIWVVTMGRHHLWILPNLTEDVGFLASFWPLYTVTLFLLTDKLQHVYQGGKEEKKKVGGKTKKGKDKDSDAETEALEKVEPVKDPEEEEKKEMVDEEVAAGPGASETESEGSQKSSTGKDFEIVERDDSDLGDK